MAIRVTVLLASLARTACKPVYSLERPPLSPLQHRAASTVSTTAWSNVNPLPRPPAPAAQVDFSGTDPARAADAVPGGGGGGGGGGNGGGGRSTSPEGKGMRWGVTYEQMVRMLETLLSHHGYYTAHPPLAPPASP